MSESAARIQAAPLVEGQVVTGTLFSEPMRVETIRESGQGTWVVGLSGVNTERFRKVTLTSADLLQLQIQKSHFTYVGDGQVLKIGVQAYSLGIAYEFDPVSRGDGGDQLVAAPPRMCRGTYSLASVRVRDLRYLVGGEQFIEQALEQLAVCL